MTPKFIMLKENTTQFFADFHHPALKTIEFASIRSIGCQEKRIHAIFNEVLN